MSARLSHALVHGVLEHITDDVEEARLTSERALDVIEGPLMDGMNPWATSSARARCSCLRWSRALA